MAKQKKKRTARNIFKKSDQPRVRAEFLDYSPEYLRWLEKTDPKAFEFLAQFNDEYIGANIVKDKKSGKPKGAIHKKAKHVKEIYDANNRRNNDLLGVSRANNLAGDVVSELDRNDGWYITNAKLTEDAIISEMETKKHEGNDILTYRQYLKVKDKLTPEMLLFYMAIYEMDDK